MSTNIISIFSSKGGVGKTFIAVNLAPILRRYAKKVLLFDMGLPYSGDIAEYLKIPKTKPLMDIIQRFDEIPPGVIQPYLSAYRDMSVATLTSRNMPADIGQIDPKKIAAILQAASSLFDLIIVDIGMTFSAPVKSVFNHTNLVLIPIKPDRLSLRKAREDIDLLISNDFNSNHILPFINMKEDDRELDTEALSKFSIPITHFLPLDKNADYNMTNKGPYPLYFEKEKLTKALDEFAFSIGKRLVHEKQSIFADTSEKKDIDEDFIKKSIFDILKNEIDTRNFGGDDATDESKKSELNRCINKITDKYDAFKSIPAGTKDQLKTELIREIIGLGPIQSLMDNDDVIEIMVNRFDEIYVEEKTAAKTRMYKSDKTFMSEKHLFNIIQKILSECSKSITIKEPYADARWIKVDEKGKTNARVNAVIRPISLKGDTLTIRKFPKDPLTVENLIKYGSLNKDIADFLEASVKARLNILVSGGTGTGKTTLLNILSEFIHDDERIITIEDSAELQLKKDHVLTRETKQANPDGEGGVSIRDLLKNSLRERPDRIIIGECRGPEALDMLQAMNTGHDGSMTTIHANSPKDALSRILTLVQQAGTDITEKAIKEQIVGAIQLIVQLKRMKDRSKKVIRVTEIERLEGNEIKVNDVFCYKQTGERNGKVEGDFFSTGFYPKKSLETIDMNYKPMPKEMFWSCMT